MPVITVTVDIASADIGSGEALELVATVNVDGVPTQNMEVEAEVTHQDNVLQPTVNFVSGNKTNAIGTAAFTVTATTNPNEYENGAYAVRIKSQGVSSADTTVQVNAPARPEPVLTE